MADGTRMQQRRATEAVWTTSAYVLAPGELGVTTDTGIIKIGNGVSPWNELDIAFGSEYLPLLGTAADSDLLGGISSAGYYKLADATTAPTADKLAMRLSDGRLQAAAATSGSDLVNYTQWSAGNIDVRKELIARTLSDGLTAVTIAVGDINGLVMIANSSLTQQRTLNIPLNSSVAIPVGSWVDVCSTDAGNLKLVPAGGVTLQGKIHIFGEYSVVRLLKTATDQWVSIPMCARRGRIPKIRVVRTASAAWPTNTETAVPFDGVDSAQTFNPDNEWFTIPAPNLSTARRVVVSYSGEYLVTVHWSGNSGNAGLSRIVFMTGNNVIGQRIASAPTLFVATVTARIRINAGESVGAVHVNSAAQSELADGSDPHAMAITLIGD